MSRFSTAGLPSPVVTPEVSWAECKALRLGEFAALMIEQGIDYDVTALRFNPGAAAAGTAAWGDLFYVQRLNDVARKVLLPSFATGSDLDLHALRAGLADIGEDPRLPGEADAALRERVRLAWKGKSAAGPDDYYRSAARNLDPRVRDVAVTAETRNASERVLIVSVLTSDNGGLLDDDLRDRLTVALNDPSFRSRNVTVEIVPAVLTTKNVSAHIYLYPETPDATIDQARAALVAAVAADQRLGFDLTRSYVEKHLHRPGVQRVELQGWQNAYAAFNEAVRLGAITLTPFRVTE